MRRIVSTLMVLLLITLLITGCQSKPKSEYTKYSDSFMDTFNTITTVVGYTNVVYFIT